MKIPRLVVVAISIAASCVPSVGSRRQSLDDSCVCPCACASQDAPPPPDVSPQVIDLGLAWSRFEITAGSPTGLYRGADGVAEDSEHCWVTAWEEGGIVTRACPVGGGWQTELVSSGLSGPEDARAADLDGDGVIDVAIAADAGQRVYVTFRGSPNTTITVGASQAHGRVMQVAIVDINVDGWPDIAFGSRANAAAAVGWLQNPGPALARLSVWWTYHEITPAGWVMSLVPHEVNADARVDLVVSDRTKRTDGTYTYYGPRWIEQPANPSDPWINHTIAGGAPTNPPTPYMTGQCATYGSTTCALTPEAEMFLAVLGNDVYDCTSTESRVDSRITIHHTPDWLTWTHVTLPPAANVGHCQGVLPLDVDMDGDVDLVVTTWKGNAYPVAAPASEESGVYWLRNNGDGTYSFGLVSGPEGGKFDNAAQLGRCVLTSEQLDPAGGLGVIAYCPPGVSL